MTEKKEIRKALIEWGDDRMIEEEAEYLADWMDYNLKLVNDNPLLVDALKKYCSDKIVEYGNDTMAHMFIRRTYEDVIRFISEFGNAEH